MTEGENSEAFRRLALRFLSYRYGRMGAEGSAPGSEVELLPGLLPEGLPVTIPLPPETSLLGSLVTGPTVSILLDTPTTSEETRRFFREALTTQGWTQPQRGRQGGFLSSAIPEPAEIFCHSPSGPMLTMQTRPMEGGTEVYLTLQTEVDRRHSPCERERYRHGRGPHEVLPALQPPPDSQVQPIGGHGSNSSFGSEADLTTDLDLEAVAAHYNREIAGAGWQPVGQDIASPFAWSLWRFTGEETGPGFGVFWALRHPDNARQYFLHLEARWGENG